MSESSPYIIEEVRNRHAVSTNEGPVSFLSVSTAAMHARYFPATPCMMTHQKDVNDVRFPLMSFAGVDCSLDC